MDYHPITKQIIDLLLQHGCWYETFQHVPVRTSEEAARTRPGYSLHQGAKAIIVKVKRKGSDDQFVMLVFPADSKFNSKKTRVLLSATDVRFASEEEVASATGGVAVGAVPPLGNLFGLDVYADSTLFDIERIVFNAGDRRFSVAMLSEDYRRLVEPTVVELV